MRTNSNTNKATDPHESMISTSTSTPPSRQDSVAVVVAARANPHGSPPLRRLISRARPVNKQPRRSLYPFAIQLLLNSKKHPVMIVERRSRTDMPLYLFLNELAPLHPQSDGAFNKAIKFSKMISNSRVEVTHGILTLQAAVELHMCRKFKTP
jgi:hypothetical protein